LFENSQKGLNCPSSNLIGNMVMSLNTLNKLGDAEIELYLSGTKAIDEAVWYISECTEGKVVMVLPYVKSKEDTDMLDWTESRLAFKCLEDAQKFCRILDVPLIDSKILDELEIYPTQDESAA